MKRLINQYPLTIAYLVLAIWVTLVVLIATEATR